MPSSGNILFKSVIRDTIGNVAGLFFASLHGTIVTALLRVPRRAPSMTAIESLKPNRTAVVYFCAAAVTIVALIVLGGWVFDISYLKSVMPNYPEMKPNTAIALALSGVGLFFTANAGRGNLFRSAVILCGIAVCLVGFVTLLEYVTGFNSGFDTLFFQAERSATDNLRPGRMSPHAALNFTIMGASLVLLSGRRVYHRAGEVLAFLVLITTYAAFLGHLYGAEQLFGISKYSSMAIHTAGLFAICSLGLFAANPNSRVLALLSSSSLGGSAARRLLPAVVLIPTVIGWLRIIGQERGLYDTGFGAVLTVFLSVVLMFAIIYFYSETIHRVDQDRKKAEHDLAEKEERYRDLFDYSQGMICIHDLNGILTTVNPAALKSLGYENDELIGMNLRDLLLEANQPRFDGYLRQIETDGLASGLLALVAKDGKPLVWRYHNILASEPGRKPYVLAHAQDVTELIAAQNALTNLSLTDDLTGLYNRRGFLTLAEQQVKLERHEGTARGLVLMFADLDGLKKINDVHGHEAGSDAIIEFSKVVKSVLRTADLVARWGGDEFVILSIGSKDEHVGIMTDRIYESLSEYNASSGKPYELACSIGVAPVPTDGDRTFESIIAEADEAMYAEKRRRKEMSGLPV